MEKEKYIYEYCLIRYVPDIERGEFLNVGLLMMCKRLKWMKCDIHIDPQKVNRLSGPVNTDILERQIAVYSRTDVPSRDLPIEEKYRWMAAVKSAIIQTSPSHPGIVFASSKEATGELTNKFAELFSRLVK